MQLGDVKDLASLLESKNNLIKFKSRDDEINCFYELLVARTLNRGAGEHKYVINNEQDNLLKSRQINYDIISEI
jgi:hypothetical protein